MIQRIHAWLAARGILGVTSFVAVLSLVVVVAALATGTFGWWVLVSVVSAAVLTVAVFGWVHRGTGYGV